MESAFVGGPVAQEEGQLLAIDLVAGEAGVLEAGGAIHEPVGLGHFVNKELFGGVGGRVVGGEIGEQGVEGGRVFAGNDDCAGSEAVLEGVAGGGGFSRGRARSGRLAGDFRGV